VLETEMEAKETVAARSLEVLEPLIAELKDPTCLGMAWLARLRISLGEGEESVSRSVSKANQWNLSAQVLESAAQKLADHPRGSASPAYVSSCH
jgi:hypothetical protein